MKSLWSVRDTEECVHVVWRSPWRQSVSIACGVGAVLVGSVCWFSLAALGGLGRGVLALLFVSGCWLLARTACVLRRTQLICTTERILFVQARGCFDCTVDQAAWADVLDIAHRPDGVWRTVGLSRIRVRFHGARREWVFCGVRHGRDICRLLRDIQALPGAPTTEGIFQRQHIA